MESVSDILVVYDHFGPPLLPWGDLCSSICMPWGRQLALEINRIGLQP